MLVLLRKIGESIHIGSNIEVKILNREHNTVFVGIEAPKEIEIWRSEIFKRMKMKKESEMVNVSNR